MPNPLLHIITPLNRPNNLFDVAVSIAESGLTQHFALTWWVMLNGPPVRAGHGMGMAGADVRMVSSPASGLDAEGKPAFGHAQRAHALDLIEGDGWVWVLDDDNLVHPLFASRLAELIAADPSAGAFVFGQLRADGRTLTPHPLNLSPGYVDTAQYVIRRDVIGEERIRPVHADDGAFVGRVYAAHPEVFRFIPEILCYWNHLDVVREAATTP